MIRFLLIFAALFSFASGQDSTVFLPEGPYLRSIRISHQPPEVLIINRPYNLDLFTGFPEDSIEQVSIFIKTGESKFFREIHLTPEYGRYRYTVEAIPETGVSFSYFYTVALKGYGIYVVPAPPPGGMAKPVERITISPIDHFRQKRTKR